MVLYTVGFAPSKKTYTQSETSNIFQSMKLFICTFSIVAAATATVLAPPHSNNKYQKFIFQLIGNEVNTFYGNLIKLCTVAAAVVSSACKNSL